MSSEALESLRSQLGSLSESERAKLARELVASLDGPPEESVEAAWGTELTQRIERFKRGEARLLTRDEFRRKLSAHTRP